MYIRADLAETSSQLDKSPLPPIGNKPDNPIPSEEDPLPRPKTSHQSNRSPRRLPKLVGEVGKLPQLIDDVNEEEDEDEEEVEVEVETTEKATDTELEQQEQLREDQPKVEVTVEKEDVDDEDKIELAPASRTTSRLSVKSNKSRASTKASSLSRASSKKSLQVSIYTH